MATSPEASNAVIDMELTGRCYVGPRSEATLAKLQTLICEDGVNPENAPIKLSALAVSAYYRSMSDLLRDTMPSKRWKRFPAEVAIAIVDESPLPAGALG